VTDKVKFLASLIADQGYRVLIPDLYKVLKPCGEQPLVTHLAPLHVNTRCFVALVHL
jgi:dienelactone hydrolase